MVTKCFGADGVAKRHCKVRYDQATASYYLLDLGSETGTWLQFPAYIFPSIPLQAHSAVRLGPYEFTVERGGSVDVLEEIVAKHRLGPLMSELRLRVSAEEFAALDVDALKTSIANKRLLQRAIADLQTYSIDLHGLLFTSPQSRFQVGLRDILIGSDPDCDIVLHALQPRHALITYRDFAYSLVRMSEDAGTMIRISPLEEIPISPSCVLNVGELKFEVCRFNVGSVSERGIRSTLEDTERVVQDMCVCEDLSMSYFSIFDGHGGGACSLFLSQNLHTRLRQALLKRNSLKFNFKRGLKESLTEVFRECDEDFLRAEPVLSKTVGSTAIVCLITGDLLTVANLGDSRAVLCRRGRAIEMSVDHKAVRET